jgi:hypothetical protein
VNAKRLSDEQLTRGEPGGDACRPLETTTQARRSLGRLWREKQIAIYQKAADAPRGLKVITNFSAQGETRVKKIVAELDLTASPDIIVIDARRDNKPSASTA